LKSIEDKQERRLKSRPWHRQPKNLSQNLPKRWVKMNI